MRSEMASKADIADVLRRAVVEYHTSVIGNGVSISELDVRLRKGGQHLNLAGPDAY